MEQLRDQLADATLHIIPDVGHLIHYEKSREAAGMIVDFLGVGRLADEADETPAARAD
jgi:pimeloyl-ACP methyl ester carboxylesterase